MTPGDYMSARAELLARPVVGPRGPRRRSLTALTDAWLGALASSSGAVDAGCALVALGGYGREQLCAGSDLDVLLLIPDHLDSDRDMSTVRAMADHMWYPIWDTGISLDHSVRTTAEARRIASRDIRVLAGLLDVRLIAGDAHVADRLLKAVLADWRALARTRLGDLRLASDERRSRVGEVAHMLEPDLKEAYGGLRDATVLREIATSWVADVPHEGLDPAAETLLDIRDALHETGLAAARRPSDVLRMQDQDDVAERCGLPDADVLMRDLGEAAREIAYAHEITWHRVARLTRQRRSTPLRRRLRRPGPERVPLADGVVLHDEEVVLATDGRPDRDPTLILRVAAAAAQAGYPLSPPTVARLARESGPLPVPWPPEARDAFVSLLGAGPGLLPVWEALDRHRIIERWIPEWSIVRSAPQRNALHVYRVDRHLVQATAYAGEYVREVARPDLLLVGALLHDIGKGHDGDHSIAGAAMAHRISARMGFAQPDIEIIVALVRHHLLLPDLATRRDVEDPVTALAVVDAVGTPSVLDALHALCRADAQATGPAAWSEWKAALIRRLVEVARAWMSGEVPPEVPPVAERHTHLLTSTDLDVLLESASGASHVVVAVADRPGLLGTIAGVLALHRVEVKSAETRTLGERAVMVWTVVPHFGELPRLDLLRADIARGLDGSLDLSARMAARRDVHRSVAPPVIAWVSGAASEADVLEVRMHDEPGLLHRLGAGLAQAGVSIIAARVSTLGSEVVDAFYVQAPNGERLTPEAREHALAVLQGALTA